MHHKSASHRADEVESVGVLGGTYLYTMTGRDTSGRFSLFDVTGPEGLAAPVHVHDHEFEAFYVVAGTVTLMLGDDEHTGGPGSFGIAPVGMSHSFRFDSPDARLLLIVTPGDAGHEALFRDISEASPAGSAPDFGRIGAIAAAHGTRVVGPPPSPRS